MCPRCCCTLKTGNKAIMKSGIAEEYDLTFIKECKTVLSPNWMVEAIITNYRITADAISNK